MARVVRSIPLASLILVSCASVGGGDALNFAQVQSLREGTSEQEVVRQFGAPRDRRVFDDGSIALAYRAENAAGTVEELRVAFDEKGLSRWTLAPRE